MVLVCWCAGGAGTGTAAASAAGGGQISISKLAIIDLSFECRLYSWLSVPAFAYVILTECVAALRDPGVTQVGDRVFCDVRRLT